ncbi:MAG: dTMP kinase [bacterium]|jgi:dTMP kinase|nr:dTMP kinase [bacterium]MDD3805599.1 dTMP kinase [bacterium]MDD4558907.1 dTMP kinase [bacterium]
METVERQIRNGVFISIEGPEGAGKSTHLNRLKDALATEGYDVILTREPGGTTISDSIRALLLDAGNDNMTSLTELLLYAAARAQHMQEVIIPSLQAGRVVLCDRFTDSTIAYQGYGRGLDIQLIKHLNDLATGAVYPHLTIILDLDPALGLERVNRFRHGGQDSKDRLEREDISFHQRIRKGFLRLAAKEPARYRIIDASRSIENVFASLFATVTDYLRHGRQQS